MTTQTITYKFRLRDKHAKELNRQADAVNYVWNFCNEVQQRAAREGRKFFNGFSLQKLTAGSSRLLGLHSGTIAKVCAQYDRSRLEQKKPWLRFRSKKSLG